MAYIQRADAIKRIKAALKAATGRTWRVYGDRGTAYGWINVRSTKDRSPNEYGYLSEEDRDILGRIFYDGRQLAHIQGLSIAPDSRDWAVQVAERAAGNAVASVEGYQS